MSLNTVWVFAEAEGGTPTSLTLEMLAKAREVASTVEAIYTGGDADAVAAPLGAHGATKVHACDLTGQMVGVRGAAAIAGLVESGSPDLIMFGGTYDARDVVARLSVALDRPVLTNATDLVVDGDTISVVEPAFGGSKLVKISFTGPGPQLAVFRPKSFVAEESGGGPAEVSTVAVPEVGAVGAAKLVNRHVEEREGPQLGDAEIVVSGGRGLGEADKYEMIEQLAKLLGAAPGASRAIVDAGWVPYAYQVGQTGKVVKPTVYIAAGISGVTQHLVGMKGSKNIIAINKDSEAPIFGVADLGIVGDVHKVLPKLIEAIQAKK